MSVLNLNKVVLAGRLTRDPELKQTPSGVAVATCAIAINRRFAKANDSQQQADFIEIVAWRQTAEFLAKYFRKGSAICVTGSIQTRSWTDQNGQKRYTTEVVIDESMFVDSKNDNAAPATATEAGADAPAYSQPPEVNYEELKTDDALPF